MRRERLLVCSALFLIACSKDTTQPIHTGTPGIRIVAGAGATDTILAILNQALIVEVRDTTGALARAGTTVRFTSQGVLAPVFQSSEAYVALLNESVFQPTATATTDAAGRASVLIRLGTQTLPARMAIDVPEFGFSDTARFVITAGRPASITVSPTDAVGLAGETISYMSHVLDRYGNQRWGDTVAWSVDGSSATISANGSMSATETGRYTITASLGALSGTAKASVLPVGRMVSWNPFVGAGSLVLSDIDGRNPRTILTNVYVASGVHQTWMPDHSGVVFTGLGGQMGNMQVVDTLGVLRPFFPSGIPFVSQTADPTPTADGKWLYFSAVDSRCSASAYCFYRSRIDGTNPELLGTSATASTDLHPSPSPDGSQIAYQVAFRGPIQVFDVATQQASSWSVSGTRPMWSPDGSRIAFITPGARVALMKPDGTVVASIEPPQRYYTSVTWSLDGKYLVASTGQEADLIDVQSGAVLPLLLPWYVTWAVTQ